MSNESTPHTLESLEELPRKADVIAIAEQAGIDTEGTRAEITARILEAQAGADGDSSSSGDGSPSESSSSADDAGSDTSSADSKEPVATGALSDDAKQLLETVVASYYGVEEAPAEMPAIFEAIEAGRQPCIITGKGNARFAVQITDDAFDCDDRASDVTDGVLSNLARILADKLIFPRG